MSQGEADTAIAPGELDLSQIRSTLSRADRAFAGALHIRELEAVAWLLRRDLRHLLDHHADACGPAGDVSAERPLRQTGRQQPISGVDLVPWPSPRPRSGSGHRGHP